MSDFDIYAVYKVVNEGVRWPKDVYCAVHRYTDNLLVFSVGRSKELGFVISRSFLRDHLGRGLAAQIKKIQARVDRPS